MTIGTDTGKRGDVIGERESKHSWASEPPPRQQGWASWAAETIILCLWAGAGVAIWWVLVEVSR